MMHTAARTHRAVVEKAELPPASYTAALQKLLAGQSHRYDLVRCIDTAAAEPPTAQTLSADRQARNM